MAAVARSRTLHADGNHHLLRCTAVCLNILHSPLAIEIRCQKNTTIVLPDLIGSDGVAPDEVRVNGRMIERWKILVRAIRAFHAWLFTDSVNPFIAAGWLVNF